MRGLFFGFLWESDAFCSALGVDASIHWRALSEPFGKAQGRLRELARPPHCRYLILMRPSRASMALPTFTKSKVGRLLGRNPPSLALKPSNFFQEGFEEKNDDDELKRLFLGQVRRARRVPISSNLLASKWECLGRGSAQVNPYRRSQ